jgi:Icc-related predicted phosphoesterase
VSEAEIAHAVDGLARRLEEPERTVFNVHCPPWDTHLDKAPRLDANMRPMPGAGGVQFMSVGSHAVRAAIESYGPMLGLHGHVHESPGAQKLGRTICINPGSEYVDGLLRGALVTLNQKKGVRGWQLVQG